MTHFDLKAVNRGLALVLFRLRHPGRPDPTSDQIEKLLESLPPVSVAKRNAIETLRVFEGKPE